MAQPSIASYFNTRKRAHTDDATTIKNKQFIATTSTATTNEHLALFEKVSKIDATAADTGTAIATVVANKINSSSVGQRTTRSGRATKRTATGTTLNLTTTTTIGQQRSEKTQQDVVPKKKTKIEKSSKQKKLVEFIKKGPLALPRKETATATTDDVVPTPIVLEMQKLNEKTPSANAKQIKAVKIINDGSAIGSQQNIERGLHTPKKQIIKGSGATPLKQNELKSLVRKELNFDEVKTKITRSAKLQELKASLNRIQELEKTRKAQEERNRQLAEALATGSPSPVRKTQTTVQLKEFDKIELEILTSPSKSLKTPTKQKLPPPTPDKNELMSPRHTDVSKRLLFSPAKDGTPSKLIVPPAYHRFKTLTETSKAGQLPLPYKYRHLIEIFKAVDAVCAMLYNRKECITFKKLKPAVQRMLRKNLTENHLAQIKHLYPDAFIFAQMKMRNYGSISKADYFQLVISPNVGKIPETELHKIDEDDVLTNAQSNAMNPHLITERLQHFQWLLLERVKDEHEKFLKQLQPPLSIPKEKVMRWHPEFDLENCPDIECAHLPQPPNVEKYSSARDILSTARNLFNCSTPMERALERYEAKLKAEQQVAVENQKNMEIPSMAASSSNKKNISVSPPKSCKKLDFTNISTATPIATIVATPKAGGSTESDASTPTKKSQQTEDVTASLLKGVPKSLLDKIRAKQAAKALDAMTRRPSQDQEATKYTRLPELARHLRNVFITERKGVLNLDIVIKKIQNSYRACLTHAEVEAHLRLIEKELPDWIAFHDVRKTMYLKIAKDMDMNKIIEKLENVANEKTK